MAIPADGRSSKLSVELWVASLSMKGLSFGTVQSHLSALRHISKRRGLSIDCQSEKLHLALKGLKRKAKSPIRKHPISTRQVNLIIRQADRILPSYTALSFKVMVSLAFYGFLRPSEYCVTPANHHLRLGDIKISRSRKYCYLRLRSFKHSTSPAVIGIANAWSTAYPIADLLQRYLDLHANRCCSDVLFDISVSEFRRTLTRVCESAGIKATISPHCFRHGGASWANKRGWSVAKITAHGRWNSQAFNAYLKPY